jgi:hypothetical protein
VLYEAFTQMKALSRQANPTMECTEDIPLERELDGLDKSWARTILDEAKWRINFKMTACPASSAPAKVTGFLSL